MEKNSESSVSKQKETQEEQYKIIKQRLYELMRIKNKNAYAEWKRFLDNEFTADTDISLMWTLLEIVQAYPLPQEVIRLIIGTMTTRIQMNYQAESEKDKAAAAAQIVQAAQRQIPKQYTDEAVHRSVSNGKRRKVVIPVILACLAVVFVGWRLISSVMSNSKEKEVQEQAVIYLNEKYGDTGYTVDDLEVDKAYLYGDAKDNMDAYYVSDKDTYNRGIYALSKKGDSVITFFDNLQSREIKQALQDKINTLTGRTEGRVFWNSSTGNDMVIEDGYFHTEYNGDFDTFIKEETDIREASRKMNEKKAFARLSNTESTALNGNCDYYLPDMAIVTMEERLTTEKIPVDEALQKNIEEYAEKYKIQIRGIVIPQIYFEEKMESVTWDSNSYAMRPSESILSGGYLHPATPFLMMTGWYVGLPTEDANALEIKNSTYTMQPVLLAEGIYGAANSMENNKRYVYTDLEQSFETTNVPKSVGLNSDQKKKAVSIRFNGKGELNEDFTLAVNKATYGIADTGYQVFVTRIDEDGEETEELNVYPYYDPEAEIKFQEVLDGEGYLFTDYEAFWEWQEEPNIITIVNP